jgi:hypothetical protein
MGGGNIALALVKAYKKKKYQDKLKRYYLAKND